MLSAETGGAVDFSKNFMPERLTPLFHTPVYHRLNLAQRRRYNQLHACYLNEQTIFFESVMARPILQCYPGRVSRGLAAGLGEFMQEEERHSAMFRALNRACAPAIYGGTDFHAIRLGAAVRWPLRWWVQCAGRFPLFLWLLLIQEERAMFYAGEFLAEADHLEPAFVAAQRKHLADEVGHVRWDEQLLDEVWPRTTPAWRRVNARLLAWLLREFFVLPRRSGWRVVELLLAEFPELRGRKAEWRDALRGLADNREFHRLAYSWEVTPRAFARFECEPEFRDIGRVLPCFHRAKTG